MGPTSTVPGGRSDRRAPRPGRRRLGVDGHRQLVGTIAGELEASLAELVDRAYRAFADPAGDTGVAGFNRQAQDVARLVNVLLSFDAPPSRRHPRALSPAAVITDAARDLELRVKVSGRPDGALFVADAVAFRTGVELLLLGLADPEGYDPVLVRIVNDDLVLFDRSVDDSDERRSWQVRYGRRLLEAEGCQLRSSVTPDRYRLELNLSR